MPKEILFPDKTKLVPAECDTAELKEKLFAVRGRIFNECRVYDAELDSIANDSFYALADEFAQSGPLNVIRIAIREKFRPSYPENDAVAEVYYRMSLAKGRIICEEAEKNGCADMLDDPRLYAAAAELMKNHKHKGSYEDVCIFRSAALLEKNGFSPEIIPLYARWPLSLKTDAEQLYYYKDYENAETNSEYIVNRWRTHQYDLDSGVLFLNDELLCDDTVSYVRNRLRGFYTQETIGYALDYLKNEYLKKAFPSFRFIAWLRGIEEPDCAVDAIGTDENGRGRIIAFRLMGDGCIKTYLKYYIDIGKICKVTVFKDKRIPFLNKTVTVRKTGFIDMLK